MSSIPFVLSLDSPTYYGHDIFPNRIYRRQHARHHEPLDLHTLGLITRLAAHGHHLGAKRDGELGMLSAAGKHAFDVHMDVGLFQPEELTVKVVDNFVVVEGKHEEREDGHGFVTRHFVRRYELPTGSNPEKIVSTLSSDGVLNITLPKPSSEDKGVERVIPIQQTGPSDLFLKGNAEKADKVDKADKPDKQ